MSICSEDSINRSGHRSNIQDDFFFKFFRQCSQLALSLSYNLHQGAAIAQDNLTTSDLDDESDLFPFALLLTRPPRRSDELVAWLHRAREPGLELLHIGGVAAPELLQQPVSSPVPRVEAVDDDAAEAHLLPRLGVDVEGVVVAIEAVEDGRLLGRLVLELDVGGLALGRGEVLGRGTFGASPVALADIEAAADGAGVDLAGTGVYQISLRLHDCAGSALVVDAEHLGPDLELLAFGGGGEGLQELDQSLAIDDSSRVELWYTGDLDGLLRGVEIDDFSLVVLEGCEMSTTPPGRVLAGRVISYAVSPDR